MAKRRSEENEAVRVEYSKKLHETDKAKLFRVDSEDVWIPKSMIEQEEQEEQEEDGANKAGGYFWIPRWLAEEKGLEYE